MRLVFHIRLVIKLLYRGTSCANPCGIKKPLLTNGGGGIDPFSFSFQGEDLEGLPFSTLEEHQSLHMDALTKLCQAKVLSHSLSEEYHHHHYYLSDI